MKKNKFFKKYKIFLKDLFLWIVLPFLLIAGLGIVIIIVVHKSYEDKKLADTRLMYSMMLGLLFMVWVEKDIVLTRFRVFLKKFNEKIMNFFKKI